jgi:hypothetical protein
LSLINTPNIEINVHKKEFPNNYCKPVLNPTGSITDTNISHFFVSSRKTSEYISTAAFDTQYAPKYSNGIRPAKDKDFLSNP